MNKDILTKTVARLAMPPKGILAIDESLPNIENRFKKLGILNTEENRRDYRELLITAPEIEKYISGYILFDETIRQQSKDGRSFASILQSKGIDIGIKVDQGLETLEGVPSEKVTKGLEGLEKRLKEYRSFGATFAKWRAIYNISKTDLGETPSGEYMQESAVRLAKYAVLCQEESIVPIVEPEVLIDGNHTIEKCYETTARNLDMVFAELKVQGVYLEGMILKTSMVLPGKDFEIKIHEEEIAKMTIKCLKEHVPPTIGAIVFLSGGQSDEDASKHLDNMHKLGPLPWPLTFSYGRAIQNKALQSFAADPSNISAAQKLLLDAAEANSKASVGEYDAPASSMQNAST